MLEKPYLVIVDQCTNLKDNELSHRSMNFFELLSKPCMLLLDIVGLEKECPNGYIKCNKTHSTNQCILGAQKCDGVAQCSLGEDEEHCPRNCSYFTCPDSGELFLVVDACKSMYTFLVLIGLRNNTVNIIDVDLY